MDVTMTDCYDNTVDELLNPRKIFSTVCFEPTANDFHSPYHKATPQQLRDYRSNIVVKLSSGITSIIEKRIEEYHRDSSIIGRMKESLGLENKSEGNIEMDSDASIDNSEDAELEQNNSNSLVEMDDDERADALNEV